MKKIKKCQNMNKYLKDRFKRDDCPVRKLNVKDDFSSYKGMVTTLASAELSSPGSRYNEVKTLVEETKDEVTNAMEIVEAEDRERVIYTLQRAPTSLL
jgi:hypothetical protein